MTDILQRQLAGQKAADSFGNGYHCAEAVVAAFFEHLGADQADAVAHATAFGGGMGKTFADSCGVLTGSMIAIGHMCGRRQRGENWDLPARLGAAVRQHFIDCHGTGNCAVLRQRFGEEKQMDECRKLVYDGTIALLEIYENRNGDPTAGEGLGIAAERRQSAAED
jgi:C_GCAxxG_C_C family probable redox protein